MSEDITTDIAMEFLDKIQSHNIDDENIFLILAKLLRLFIAGIEKQEGEVAAKVRFMQFIKMYDLCEDLANKVVSESDNA